MLPKMQRNVLAVRRINRGSLDGCECSRRKYSNVGATRRRIGKNVRDKIGPAHQIIRDNLVDDCRLMQWTITCCLDDNVSMMRLSSSNYSRKNVLLAARNCVCARLCRGFDDSVIGG